MIRIPLSVVLVMVGISALGTAIDAPTVTRTVAPPTPGEIVLMAGIGAALIASAFCLLWDGLNRIGKP